MEFPIWEELLFWELILQYKNLNPDIIKKCQGLFLKTIVSI